MIVDFSLFLGFVNKSFLFPIFPPLLRLTSSLLLTYVPAQVLIFHLQQLVTLLALLRFESFLFPILSSLLRLIFSLQLTYAPAQFFLFHHQQLFILLALVKLLVFLFHMLDLLLLVEFFAIQQLLVVQQRMQTRREVEAAEAKQRRETIVAETQMKSADCFSKIGPIIFSNLFMSQ